MTRAELTGAESPPDVSIIIAQRNQSPYLAEAIESALAQTGCSREVIVVDDGSDDDSAAIAARYPEVILIEQSQQGACAARNAGIRRSSGRHFVFLDGDDRMLPDAVQTGLQALAESPGAAVSYGSFSRISASGQLLTTGNQPTSTVDHFAYFLLRNPIVLHVALFRRDVVEGYGGFVARDWLAADYDLYLKALRDYPAVCHGKVIGERRIHTAQASRSDAPTLASAVRVLNRQWPHVRNHPARRAALLAGRKHFQDWFGERLVTEAHLAARTGRWIDVLRRLLTLLRYYPRGAFAFVRGLRRSATMSFRVLPQGSVGDGAAPGAGLPSPGEDALSLRSLDPPCSTIGEAFARMQGDQGILFLGCRNASPLTVAIFDGFALETYFKEPTLLMAFVPPEYLRRAGDKPVYLLK